jgi:hypothetical protein
MASQTDVINRALIKLGAGRITSIDDDLKQAQLAKSLWDTTRDVEQAAHPWTFAKARAELPALATAPAFGWARAFQLPSSFLRMIEVGQFYVLYAGGAELFELEGQTILTDEGSPLAIRYIQRVTNVGLFPPLFVEALATRLAHQMCEALTQSLPKKQELAGEYKEAIRAARKNNAIELPPQASVPSSWELARL